MTLTPAAIREYDDRAPSSNETKTATFATGCFWGPDATFGAIDGVVRTRVGYAGGTKRDPSYRDLGEHSEVFQVDYDPEATTYTALLDRVFELHDPTRQPRTRQYQNVVFTTTPEQREALDAYLSARNIDPDAIETRFEQLSRFHPAEPYHQKHSLRATTSLMRPFEEAGYGDDDLRESPAAAALNGHASSHETTAAEELGLTDDRTVRSR